MMCNSLPAPADTYSPDANRVGPGAPARLPEWIAHLIALVIRCTLGRMFAARPCHSALPSWWHDRPDLPLGSVQALAASRRGAFGNAMAWMCRRLGIGPGHPDWGYLSRSIVAFGGSVAGFRAGLPACGLQWWENHDIVPGMIGMPTPTPAADAMAGTALAPGRCRCSTAGTARCLRRRRACATAGHPAEGLCPLRHWSADRAARCPGSSTHLLPDARGRSMAGPAVLIRADRISRARSAAPAGFGSLIRPGCVAAS